MSKTECPNCGNLKKPWFKLCFECNEKEKQKPSCEVCGIVIQEGHNLCKEHWLEKQEELKSLKSIDFVKSKKQTEFKEKFEGKYYFNGIPTKSKAELLLLCFFEANGLHPRYETPIYLSENKEYHPDFTIEDGDNLIIIEHFGLNNEEYKGKRDKKIKEYQKLLKENKGIFFVWTDEDDMCNLKERLGKKLNETPLKRLI